jgi:hypothetical protein
VKLAEVAFASTLTDTGTIRFGLPLDNPIDAAAAPGLTVTVQAALPGVAIVVGLQLTPVRVGPVVAVTTMEPPVAVTGRGVPAAELPKLLDTAIVAVPLAVAAKVTLIVATVPLAIVF